jgi:hypothetical protein
MANDLAFAPGCSEAEYTRRTEAATILQLAWRMEHDGDMLRPT